MGLFKKAKRALGYEDPKLRERGIRGTAKVLSAERTMMSEESGSGRNIRVSSTGSSSPCRDPSRTR